VRSFIFPLVPARLGALLVGLLWIAACGDDDAGPMAPAPAVGLQLSTSELALRPGGTALLPVTILRQGGFEGTVTLDIRGLPEGITAEGEVVPEGVSSAAVSFHAAESAPVGSAVVTLEASAPGVEPSGTTLALTVEDAAGIDAGGFTLSLSPGALSIRQGESDSVRVAVSRTLPFDGPVRLEVTGIPKDISALVDPATVTGSEAVILVDVGADAALGDASITLVGTADGVDDHSVQLVLTTFGS